MGVRRSKRRKQKNHSHPRPPGSAGPAFPHHVDQDRRTRDVEESIDQCMEEKPRSWQGGVELVWYQLHTHPHESMKMVRHKCAELAQTSRDCGAKRDRENGVATPCTARSAAEDRPGIRIKTQDESCRQPSQQSQYERRNH